MTIRVFLVRRADRRVLRSARSKAAILPLVTAATQLVGVDTANIPVEFPAFPVSGTYTLAANEKFYSVKAGSTPIIQTLAQFQVLHPNVT